MPKPDKEKQKPDLRNAPRAEGYKVYTDAERKELKAKALKLRELLDHAREPRKIEEEKPKDWLEELIG